MRKLFHGRGSHNIVIEHDRKCSESHYIGLNLREGGDVMINPCCEVEPIRVRVCNVGRYTEIPGTRSILDDFSRLRIDYSNVKEPDRLGSTGRNRGGAI